MSIDMGQEKRADIVLFIIYLYLDVHFCVTLHQN